MRRLLTKPPRNPWKIQGKCVIWLVVFFWLGGCSLWNSYLDPDYQSTRADRLCHPYGECSQGTWVAADGSANGSTEAKARCHEEVDRLHGHGWWKDSVARGLEIGSCMEEQGYTLRQ